MFENDLLGKSSGFIKGEKHRNENCPESEYNKNTIFVTPFSIIQLFAQYTTTIVQAILDSNFKINTHPRVDVKKLIKTTFKIPLEDALKHSLITYIFYCIAL